MTLRILTCAALLWFAASGAFAQERGFYYTVRSGDSLERVAARFGVSEITLAKANRMTARKSIVAGSRLWVPRAQRVVVHPATTAPHARSPVSSSVRTSSLPVIDTSKFAPSPAAPARAQPSSDSDTYIVQPGDSLWKIGKNRGMTATEVAKLNGLSPDAQVKVGQKLRMNGDAVTAPAPAPERQTIDVPGGGIIVRGAPEPAPAPAPVSSSGSGIRPSRSGYIWPAEGRILRKYTQRSDEKYTGIDIAIPKGTEVRAAKDGKVVYSGESVPAYGRMVIIDHGGGFATCYGHNSQLLAREGQSVRRGQVIARSGNSGRGGEAFLHFEMRKNTVATDPEPYLP